MLQQIQKELIKNKTFKFAIQVEEDFEKYLKLKQEYEQLPALAKQKLSDQLKVFLFLNAYNKDDLFFAAYLVMTHDYDKFEQSAVKLTLGRFYSKIGRHKPTIDYLLPLFEKRELEKNDVGVLYSALSKMGMHRHCEQVLSFTVENYPDDLQWKIEAVNHQITMDLIKDVSENQNVIMGNLNYLSKHCKTSKDYITLAASFYQVNNIDEFLKLSNLALETVALDTEKEVAKPDFDSALCRETMEEMLDILDTNEIKAFPIGGSLLGLYRDGKFMDYDKDADIGIFIRHYEDVFKIVSILCKVPKFTATAMVNKPKASHLWNVAIYDSERNVMVDLFFFHREAEQVVEGVHTNYGILKWAFTPFELVQKELAGKVYWVPENVELFLTELYDDWRKPVEVWDSLIDCPNLLPSSQPVVVYYGLMRLWEALQKNKTVKALNYYQKLTTRWGMKFSAEADANIRKLLNLVN